MKVRTRLLGLLVVVALMAGLMPLTAVAHTPKVEAKCGELTVSLTNYNGNGENSVKVTINDVVMANASFGEKYSVSFFPSKDTDYTYEVVVKAHDDPEGKWGWTKTFRGTVKACEKPPVDYCDASNKPSGDLGAWLEQGGNPDCIDIEVIPGCGMVTGSITRNETNWDTWDVAFEIGDATYDLGNAEFGSIKLPEGSGKVTVSYYLVGPEGDYGKISGEPNFWKQNARTIKVDTNCVCPSGYSVDVPSNFGVEYAFGYFGPGWTWNPSGTDGLEPGKTYTVLASVKDGFVLSGGLPDGWFEPQPGVYAYNIAIGIEDKNCDIEVPKIRVKKVKEEVTTTTTLPTTTTTTSSTTTSTTPTTEETLPFTGIEDYYGGVAVALVALGGLVLALSRKPEEEG